MPKVSYGLKRALLLIVSQLSLNSCAFIEELQNALDEIKKNEKETNVIAMVAQTLFEKTDTMGARIHELDDQLLALGNQQELKDTEFMELQANLDDARQRYEQMEALKIDADK
jgi:chromosome segregation ATPase